MNTATRNLEDDHIYILKLTDVMEIIARSENPDINHIESIIDIIRNFADGLHHAKEENLFFPALEQKGFSSRQGPVAVMLHEHVEGRNFVKGIADNLELLKKDNKQAISKLFENMLGYAELLRNHIAKENNILFRMADNALSDNEQKQLLAQFKTVEKNRKEGTRVEDYIDRIKTFAAFYKV
jgi:hemerythrin-like domain-containing protein